MFPDAARPLHIKDLKDLRFYCATPFYRHAGPKGPEEVFSRERSRGPGPRATVKKSVPFPVGRGPVPRRAIGRETALAGVRFSRRSSDRGGQAPALRARKGSLR